MTTTNQPTFTPGKFYKTRDGRKARIYATDGLDDWPIHGGIFYSGGWMHGVWRGDGTYLTSGSHPYDLIAEWKDAPVVDWSKMPAWANWVAQDGDRSWFWYNEKPELSSFLWRGCFRGSIPSEFAPQFSGDWRDSLVERPQP